MSYDPFKVIPAVMVVLTQAEKILLVKRTDTGYMDGMYALPGGHLEKDEPLVEGAARECLEEIGISVDPKELQLIHIYQNVQKDTNRQYIGFLFRCRKWQGEPSIKDPKVADVKFFDLDTLPDNLIPYHRQAFKHINDPPITITYTELNGSA